MDFTARALPSAFRLLFRSSAGFWTIAGIICFFVYSSWVLSYHSDPKFEPKIASFLAVSFCLLFSSYSWSISRKQNLDGRVRRAWRAFALAGASYAMAEIVWFYYQSVLGQSPFISLADVFYFLFYPLLLTGILLLPHAPVSKQERFLLWLDLAIIVTTTFTVVWYFVLAPADGKSLQGIKGIVAIAYPVGSVLIISAILALLKRDLQKVAFWPVFFLGAGMFCSTIADVLFAYFGLNGIPHSQAHLNVLWLACLLFLLIAAACQEVMGPPETPEDVASPKTTTFLRAAIPYIFTTIGVLLVLLVFNSVALPGVRFGGILVGTLILFVLVLVRQGILLRENINLYEKMQYLANTDSLTGVYNRLFSTNALRMEMTRAGRYNRPLSILLIDLDDFKKYNDEFGHLQGDEALKTVATMMNTQLRISDVLGRFGGDEFLVVLPETDSLGAHVVADKIKKELSLTLHQGHSIGVTIGVATYQKGQSPERLIEAADQELYRLKKLSPRKHEDTKNH